MNNEIQYQPLLKSIDKWEQNSVDAVRKTAQEVREQVSQILHRNKSESSVFNSFHGCPTETDKALNFFFKYLSTEKITQDLQSLKEQIRNAREEDDFFENDLQNWIAILEKLKKDSLNVVSSNTMEVDQTIPLIYQIRIATISSKKNTIERRNRSRSQLQETKPSTISSNEEKYARYKDIPNSVNLIPSRLQYTNHDGAYMNPKSLFVTAVWYFYSPKYNS
ncbi:unnamed protein product [Rotaria magnacalcarata]|uniref:Uncharacterized protein n=1 Tax=Rotaria magnacalcarata TaxID=392030 RepID=A0A814UR13_9BILA|nr:unnamed protein product [Rotaria magnacalcarata]CAF1363499.1 unnamed protein product [Rotaria magnacalcarata]